MRFRAPGMAGGEPYRPWLESRLHHEVKKRAAPPHITGWRKTRRATSPQRFRGTKSEGKQEEGRQSFEPVRRSASTGGI